MICPSSPPSGYCPKTVCLQASQTLPVYLNSFPLGMYRDLILSQWELISIVRDIILPLAENGKTLFKAVAIVAKTIATGEGDWTQLQIQIGASGDL